MLVSKQRTSLSYFDHCIEEVKLSSSTSFNEINVSEPVDVGVQIEVL